MKISRPSSKQKDLKLDDFYTARDSFMTPLQWTTFTPPFTKTDGTFYSFEITVKFSVKNTQGYAMEKSGFRKRFHNLFGRGGSNTTDDLSVVVPKINLPTRTLPEEKPRRLAESGMVIGPEGTPLSLADLPKPNTVRWVIRRKAEVVAAVKGGLLTFEEACERYNLAPEDLTSWQKSMDSHTIAELRSRRTQK